MTVNPTVKVTATPRGDVRVSISYLDYWFEMNPETAVQLASLIYEKTREAETIRKRQVTKK